MNTTQNPNNAGKTMLLSGMLFIIISMVFITLEMFSLGMIHIPAILSILYVSLGILFIIVSLDRNKTRKVNYDAFLSIGLVFSIIGALNTKIGILPIGIIFFIIGIIGKREEIQTYKQLLKIVKTKTFPS